MNEDKVHLMIDLETYSTLCNGVFRSVGGVLFDLNEHTESMFNYGVDIEDALMAGLVIDKGAIDFWRNQPKENRNRLLNMPKSALIDVLEGIEHTMREVFSDLSKVYLWSHGSNFDVVLLENAYNVVGMKAWWKYSNVRDTRTFFDVTNYTYKSKGGHDALDDATNQALAVQEAYKQFTKGGK